MHLVKTGQTCFTLRMELLVNDVLQCGLASIILEPQIEEKYYCYFLHECDREYWYVVQSVLLSSLLQPTAIIYHQAGALTTVLVFMKLDFTWVRLDCSLHASSCLLNISL